MIERNIDELPMADPGRERDARELFPIHDMTSEEYAEKYRKDWLCFSFDDYRYSDPELDRWIQRLGDIFFNRGRELSHNEHS